MSATATHKTSNTDKLAPEKKAKNATRISWEEFERKYLIREDSFKYEWVNGLVEKTKRTMNQQQQFIWLNLMKFLNELKKGDTSLGELIPEVDTFFEENHRRPDISYFSPQQISVFRHTNEVPDFVIEVISSKDQLNAAHEKLADYRDANVTVVWHVFPKLQEIHVYHGKHMTICLSNDTCSAEPVIPGFSLLVADIFQ